MKKTAKSKKTVRKVKKAQKAQKATEWRLTTESLYAIVPDSDGWRTLPNGNCVKVGENCTLGYGCSLGNYVTLGDDVTLGYDVTLGDRCSLGNSCSLGAGCSLGDGCKLGNYVKLPANSSSEKLNEEAINKYIDLQKLTNSKLFFTKWVTKERKSYACHRWAESVTYNKGEVVEEPSAEKSDRQCDRGLHVLPFGHRPEWYGLAEANHELIPLTVEVDANDILYAGAASSTGKLRVRKLKVLD